MIKIRLSRTGKKNMPSYRIVVSESKFPRDGKYIEKLGFYNFFNKKNIFNIDVEKFKYWIKVGAKVSKRIKYLIKKYK